MHRVCCAIAACAIVGCGGSSATAPTAGAIGTYTLSTVSGTPLPALILSPTYGQTQVTFSRIDLGAGGVYHDSTVLGAATLVDDGTWSVSGSTVTIQTATWTVTASVTASNLSVPFAETPLGNFTYKYARQ